MDESVESRLARLERELADAKTAKSGTAFKPPRRRILWLAGIVVLAATGVAGYVFLHSKPVSEPPVVTSLRQLSVKTMFTMYYPQHLPSAYSVDLQSLSVHNDVVFYTLRAGSQSIIVSQQQKPASVDSIKKIDGLSETQMRAGKAFIGKTTLPAAILLADTTLISFQGSAGVSSSDLYDTVSAMTVIHR